MTSEELRKDECCLNCAYCDPEPPYDGYEGYCRKTDIWLSTIDDRLCQKYEEYEEKIE